MDHLHSRIHAGIRQLANDYRNAPGTILTEDDLKCLLVSRLLEIPELRRPKPTADLQVRGTMVHTEVSWFDENGKLGIKPDITILDPRGLSIFRALREGYPLPSKQFNFVGSSIIFELKFIRNKTGVTKESVRKVRKDLNKVFRLFDRLSQQEAADELYCFFVIFSKVDRRVPEFDELINQAPPYPRCRIIFETAGVHWPAAPRHDAH
jgi:hypothetical protein